MRFLTVALAALLAVCSPAQAQVSPLVAGDRPSTLRDASTNFNRLGVRALKTAETSSFFADDASPVLVNKIGDRFFAGGATKYTGRRTAPLGGDFVSENAANYFIKNAQAAIYGTTRGGLLVAAYTAPGQASTLNSGLMAVSVNKGEKSFGRGIYAEAFHMSTNGGGTVAIEAQGGNYTDVDPNSNSYRSGGQGTPLFLAAEAGHNYVLGDDNRPLTAPTKPVAEAIDIAGGSISSTANYQKFKVGINLRTSALFRGTDGFNGPAVAMSLAQNYELRWFASKDISGAVIRSDVQAIAGRDKGLIFSDNETKISGAGERAVATFSDDIASAGAINWLAFKNSRTNVSPLVSAKGADTNVGLEVRTQGVGSTRFTSHDGVGENLRIQPPNTAPVNFALVAGGAAGSPVAISAAGAEATVHLKLSPKGTDGRLQFGTYTATPSAVAGYIEIQDAGGTLRKLAVLQ